MFTKQLPILFFTFIFVSACSQNDGNESADPSNAKGDTNVRHIICNVGDTDCFVSARFDSFASCEYYKKFSSMLCDSVSHPEQMLCKTNPNPAAVGYCTQ